MSLFRPNIGTTQTTVDDLSTPSTQIFAGRRYTKDYEGYKQVSFRAQPEGGGIYSIEVNTNKFEYIDFTHAYMVYTLKLKNGGGQTAKYDQIFVVPDVGNGLWETVQVKISDREVPELTVNKVGYTEYVKGLINTDPNTYYSQQYPRMFIRDEPGLYDDPEKFKDFGMTYTKDEDTKKYKLVTDRLGGEEVNLPEGYTRGTMTEDDLQLGIWRRHALCTDEEHFQVVTPVPSHLYGAQRDLPPGMSLRFIFHPQNPNFYLLTLDPDVNLPYDLTQAVEIVDMKMSLGITEVNPIIRLSHEKTFLANHVAQIPFTQVVMYDKEFPVGSSRLCWTPFRGYCPKQVHVAMVDSDNFRGRLTHSPYIFHHFDARNVALRLGHSYVPHSPIETDFKENKYVEQFWFTLQNMGLTSNNHTSLIGMSEWVKDTTIYAFDLTQDRCNQTHLHYNVESDCVVEVTLRTPLTKTVTMIVFGSYDKLLELDQFRQPFVANA